MRDAIILGVVHTRICEWDRRCVEIAECSPDWRHNDHRDGTEGANDDGPEIRWLLSRRPAQVAQGAGPESGGYGGHCEVVGRLLRVAVSIDERLTDTDITWKGLTYSVILVDLAGVNNCNSCFDARDDSTSSFNGASQPDPKLFRLPHAAQVRTNRPLARLAAWQMDYVSSGSWCCRGRLRKSRAQLHLHRGMNVIPFTHSTLQRRQSFLQSLFPQSREIQSD